MSFFNVVVHNKLIHNYILSSLNLHFEQWNVAIIEKALSGYFSTCSVELEAGIFAHYSLQNVSILVKFDGEF